MGVWIFVGSIPLASPDSLPTRLYSCWIVTMIMEWMWGYRGYGSGFQLGSANGDPIRDQQREDGEVRVLP